MIKLRKAEERGHADHGWLNTYHTFSFNTFSDPEYNEFRVLRVMNEDSVRPGMGFGTHGHRDMEIVSYVLEGALAHKDSMGNGEVLRPGELQRMSAGTGIRHSEFNGSDELTHFYQIWLYPEKEGLEPSYEQKAFPVAERQGKLQLVAAREPEKGALTIHQDVKIYLANLAAADDITRPIAAGRHLWVQALRGAVEVNGVRLGAGDGLAMSEEPELRLRGADAGGGRAGEAMVFDLP